MLHHSYNHQSYNFKTFKSSKSFPTSQTYIAKCLFVNFNDLEVCIGVTCRLSGTPQAGRVAGPVAGGSMSDGNVLDHIEQ